MSDPFRQFFLESIQATLQQEANQEAILALFKFVTPSLTIDDMLAMDTKDRNKMMKVLKTRIHPDKHPNEPSVTQLFQNVQVFYDECIANISNHSSSRDRDSKSSSKGRGTRKRSRSSKLTINTNYPQSFSCFDQWPCMKASVMSKATSEKTKSSPTHFTPPSKIVLSAYQAYKCIHARGALAHGRPITKYKRLEQLEEIQKQSKKQNSVYEIFEIFGGTKELDTIEAIKDELMKCGPVISASFRLLDAYLERLRVRENAFVKVASGCTHELLIVGWCLTPYGEAWQVQPIMDGMEGESQPLEIGFGQFDIDELVLAPDNSLEHISWQPGPYFDYDFSEVENWRKWKEMDLPIGENELKILAKCFKNGLMSGETFVLRDETKKAHSGTYKVNNFRWEDKTNEWFIQVCQYVSKENKADNTT